jgi:hypothetical protein
MHDIDRTQREFESAVHELQPEQFEFTGEAETTGEFPGETLGEAFEAGLHEAGYEAPYGESAYEAPVGESAYEGTLPESEEMELAAEMLEITNEAELDHFLGGLIRKIGRAVGRVVKSPLGRALGGVLKPLAKAALPIAGSAVGTFFGGPIGGAIGGKLASAAGGLFGLELEGLSQEDREFEVARRFVRLSSAATRHALRAAPTAAPVTVAKAALVSAARRFAPGLIRVSGYRYPTVPVDFAPSPTVPTGTITYPSVPAEPVPAGARRRGIWYRRGRRIILLGV